MQVNLVLSGGGARGFAHPGMIKALVELGFEPVAVSGTSAGAMAGAFIAAGYPPEEILELFIKNNFFKMVGGAFNKGLLNMDKIETFFRASLPSDFSALQMPLSINATDILTGSVVWFNSGELVKPVLASASIPGLFKPIVYEDKLLVDGGVMNNLPVEPFVDSSLKIIGMHVNHVGVISSPSTTWSVLERSFELGVYSNAEYRRKQCDIYLEPEGLSTVKIFDYQKARAIYQLGYDHVMQRRNELLSVLR
jgi:NTE family protein